MTVISRISEYLRTNPDQTPTQVAEAIKHNSGNVSSAMTRMARSGILSRRENVGNKRSPYLYSYNHEVTQAQDQEPVEAENVTVKFGDELLDDEPILS